ncbi:hypothetical protein KY285_020898 [Solanum tuberosum]|nr:hypothetical protein KY285_020898 [Solanum tuberosum]
MQELKKKGFSASAGTQQVHILISCEHNSTSAGHNSQVCHRLTAHNFCEHNKCIFSSLYKQVTSHNSQAFYFHNSQKSRNGKQFDQCCCSLQAFVAKEQTNFNKHLTCNLQYH